MSTPTDVTRAPSRARCRAWIPAVVAAVLVFGHPPSSVADPSETKTFPSAGDASEALFQAVQIVQIFVQQAQGGLARMRQAVAGNDRLCRLDQRRQARQRGAVDVERPAG